MTIENKIFEMYQDLQLNQDSIWAPGRGNSAVESMYEGKNRPIVDLLKEKIQTDAQSSVLKPLADTIRKNRETGKSFQAIVLTLTHLNDLNAQRSKSDDPLEDAVYVMEQQAKQKIINELLVEIGMGMFFQDGSDEEIEPPAQSHDVKW